MRITPDLISDVIDCRYKAHLKVTGMTGDKSPFEVLQMTLDAEYRGLATEHLRQTVAPKEIQLGTTDLKAACHSKADFILNVTAANADCDWTFQAMERPKTDRRPEHRPARFSRKMRLTEKDKLIAACDGLILGDLEERAVDDVTVVHGPFFTTTKIRLQAPVGPTRLAREARRHFNDLATLQSLDTVVPKQILNQHCDVCEFRIRCRSEAEQRDDLSLLRGLRPKEIEVLHKRGVFTVTQLAYTFRAKSIGRGDRQPKRHSQPLQAMAIRDKMIYVRQKPTLSASPTRVFLDIEGTPDTEWYYLLGMIVEHDGIITRHQFWADKEADEQTIWHKMLDVLRNSADCPVFHFGRYERTFIERMRRRYSASDTVVSDAVLARLFDIHAAIRTNVYLPVYSNGLKAIALYLGAQWSGPISSGLDSIVWRDRWERERNDKLKEDLLRYNLDDCEALRVIADFLVGLANDDQSCQKPIQTVDKIPNSSKQSFGGTRFALPEISHFIKCAYFNYQREKIFVRTDKYVRRHVKRKKRAPRTKVRINIRIQCPPLKCCPSCGSRKLCRYDSTHQSKVVKDIKFTSSGVKRWVVEYVTGRYLCRRCNVSGYSPEYPTGKSKFGRGVGVWAIYQQIELRQTCRSVAESLTELFGIPASDALLERVRTSLARQYEPTEQGLVARLRQGAMICADEAKVAMKGGSGYVWTFSNSEEVVYRYSDTREGDILAAVLGDFSGVLVSDFYGAYDSAKCPQQKCIIHLIRDINDDLLKTPFDNELKALAERFTSLLKPIVETIDRFGLKKRHLGKFVRDADRYQEWLARQEFGSAAALRYQKRIGKYGQRLFTFLSHDGVPWNNNLAENAVKLIASRRRYFGASFSKAGMRDYLLFLSIYQTVRRKGGSFRKFLLSSKTDLFEFLGE